MTQGIGTNLNLMLARVSSIESNFNALNGIMSKISGEPQAVQSEFKNILDGKIEAQIETSKAPVAPLDEDLEPQMVEAINLKSKIDLDSQKTDIEEIVETFSNKYGVDGDLIKAIIKQESGFNPRATSKKGAMGLMQLMPQTAKSLGIINAYNPWENVEGGVKHIKGLLNKYNNNTELALAAYNAGAGAVKKYGGVPPYKETQNYVKSIMTNYNKIKGVQL